MSLFTSINLAKHSLIASQIGLQVTGNNIANANTPGYIREEVVYAPGPTQQLGDLVLGTGVDVVAVVQKVDKFLQQRLRDASSDLASGEVQEEAYLKLESVIAELSETDLSTSLNNFFNSIHDVLNQPESLAVRNLAILRADSLAGDIRRMDSRVRDIREDVNDRIAAAADDVNRLLEEIADLNLQIIVAEGGRQLPSDAVGLRDRREAALTELAKIIDIHAVEQDDGSVNVFTGGDYLVIDSQFRPVKIDLTFDRGLPIATIRIAETGAAIKTSTGKVAGLTTARDAVLGGFLDGLNDFVRTLAFEFNKLFSGGQGLTGYDQLTSEFAVDDPDNLLDQADLPFTPVNGSFQVLVKNTQTGLTKTTDVFVDLDGLDDDTSLSELAAALDAIDGISASITNENHLSISADSPTLKFAFKDDTSGALAALGINTLFSGSSALDIGVSQPLRSDASKFAASRNGIGADTENGVLLADLLNKPLDAKGGTSLAGLYDELTGSVAQGASATRAMAEGFRVFQRTLEGQHQAISGVSLDEEAVKMLMYQRTFQAAAKLIATVNELLETLVSL